MRRPSELLPRLVPGLYTARDSTLSGRPLQRLLSVLGGELDALAREIDGLWDDHFVERASNEALPLLAELLGARLLTEDPRTWRAVLARSIAWRRRKGTLATLEEILSLTSRWDAEIEESFRSLLSTQELLHLVPWRGRTTLLWDPIGLADPLSRRSAGIERPRDGEPSRAPLLSVAPGETVDQALRRLGRADAGRHAASPRTVDLLGWARPDVALVRTARLVPVELEEMRPGAVQSLPGGYLGFRVDPLDRDGPLVWLQPRTRPELLGGLTERHEPESSSATSSGRTAAVLLTPTALAEDPSAAERAGALTVSVDGIPLVGPRRVPRSRGPLPVSPVGPEPVLHLTDDSRPATGDAWRLTLAAAREDTDIPLLSTEARPGTPGAVTATPEARQLLHGATTVLLVERTEGEARQRDATGAWSPLQVGGRQGPPRSPAVAVTVGGLPLVVRAEQRLATGELRLARFEASATGTQWEAVALGGTPPPADSTDMGAASAGEALLLVTGDAEGRLGAWRVTGLDSSPVAERIDTPGPRRPLARRAPSTCVLGDRLFVFGGEQDGAPLGELWSVPLAGGPWRPHPVRHRQERKRAALLATAARLVLLGGELVEGELATTVFQCEPSASFPIWRPLPSLPLEPGLPGSLVARATPTGLEALVWADRTRPRLYRLDTGATAWTEADGPELDAPNPPTPGEALFVGERVLVVGPSPLPASEVVFSMEGESHLAFLPELRLLPRERLRFHVANDGATFAEARPGQPIPLDARPGGALHEGRLSASAGELRLALPGRLRRHFFRLLQRSLGPWDSLLPRTEEGFVALDPRLGRVLLPGNAPSGQITLSARVGRGTCLGAGCLPPTRQPPASWLEPEFPTPTPPDLRAIPRSVTAWVSPSRAGGSLTAHGEERPIVATPEEGVAPGPVPAVLGILGSPRLGPVRLASEVDAGLSLFAADPGSVPFVEADARGRALALLPGFGGRADTEFWLAGLWLGGSLELALARGQADVRWCHLGQPGETGLWVPGAGHQEARARRSLPPVEVELRLYGCMVGTVELPPWVRLVAAGCTFDAGSRDAVALQAAGARVRLRHCTVLGATEAGVLEASSCAFAGEVRTDRKDLGWLRHSLLARGGRPPSLYQSLVHTVSFVSVRQTDPGYLVLAENNGPVALHTAERGGVPGAHGERSEHLRELLARTDENLPIGMVPFHVDRTTEDLERMGRR